MRYITDITDFIPKGEQNAITARELAALLHCHWRDVTRSINYLRQHDDVICSCARGYFLPVEETEVQRFVRTMKSRQRQIRLATVSAEKRLRLWAIQNEFDGLSLFDEKGAGDSEI